MNSSSDSRCREDLGIPILRRGSSDDSHLRRSSPHRSQTRSHHSNSHRARTPPLNRSRSGGNSHCGLPSTIRHSSQAHHSSKHRHHHRHARSPPRHHHSRTAILSRPSAPFNPSQFIMSVHANESPIQASSSALPPLPSSQESSGSSSLAASSDTASGRDDVDLDNMELDDIDTNGPHEYGGMETFLTATAAGASSPKTTLLAALRIPSSPLYIHSTPLLPLTANLSPADSVELSSFSLDGSVASLMPGAAARGASSSYRPVIPALFTTPLSPVRPLSSTRVMNSSDAFHTRDLQSLSHMSPMHRALRPPNSPTTPNSLAAHMGAPGVFSFALDATSIPPPVAEMPSDTAPIHHKPQPSRSYIDPLR